MFPCSVHVSLVLVLVSFFWVPWPGAIGNSFVVHHVLQATNKQILFMTASFTFCIAGGTAYRNAHFGAGSGQIFLDDVQYTSSANQLLECSSRPILSHNCLHSDDAGVGCEGKE